MKNTESFLSANLSKKKIGSLGEELAALYIRMRGYKILERNYNVPRVGELDIVAEDSEYLCFVEVRLRSRRDFGTPAETVTREKRRRLIRAAQCYILHKNMENRCVRFDVAEVYGGKIPRVNLIKDAFRVGE